MPSVCHVLECFVMWYLQTQIPYSGWRQGWQKRLYNYTVHLGHHVCAGGVGAGTGTLVWD